ncbi:uncharacterized protein LOC134260491 [Saccostrea cucullata]|uniref:uncharacterized protein LOC134260491 n=1 Tax=Saccostrea cuccullata TaxID=36930 RepID=UPI002ED15594
MAEYNNLKLSILFLITTYKTTEGSCYIYYDGPNEIQDCSDNTIALAILGGSYGGLLGLGIFVSLIVCICCMQRKNREWSHGAVIIQTLPGVDNPNAYLSGHQQVQHSTLTGTGITQNPNIMMTPTNYGRIQGQDATPVNFQIATLNAGANPTGTVQQENN